MGDGVVIQVLERIEQRRKGLAKRSDGDHRLVQGFMLGGYVAHSGLWW